MALTLTPATMVTAQDYRLVPAHGPRYQFIEGELVRSPAPNRFHQDISRNIEFILLKYLAKNPIGKIYDAPFDVFLNEHNVFQPDLIFVGRERQFILTDAGAEGAPDLVIEILSESTAHLDRIPKRQFYAAAGVRELWLVEPKNQSIEIYFLSTDAERPAFICQEKDTFTSPSFPGLAIATTEIFQR